jgi:putative ABC transport system ATP-binding protein
VSALRGVEIEIRPRELVVIRGPSGSGKTTLLSILGLLLKPTTGAISVLGRDVTALGERDLPAIRSASFGFVFQSFALFPSLTALDNVALAIQAKGYAKGREDQEAARLLRSVGLGDRLDHYPRQLSGGEQQRASIARALCGDPPILLADEPTAALDSKSGLSIMEAMRARADAGQAVVVVTHDLRLEQFASRVLLVEDGRVSEVAPVS